MKSEVKKVMTALDSGKLITITRNKTTQYTIQKDGNSYTMNTYLFKGMRPIPVKILNSDLVDLIYNALEVNMQNTGATLHPTPDGGYLFFNEVGDYNA